eukprot:766367-Hanusia_phi.AAC.1
MREWQRRERQGRAGGGRRVVGATMEEKGRWGRGRQRREKGSACLMVSVNELERVVGTSIWPSVLEHKDLMAPEATCSSDQLSKGTRGEGGEGG